MEVGAVRQVQNELGKDAYLQLFAVQAQNQNPLDPLKGDQLLSDLAQFTALEQMTNVNTNFEKLLKEVGEMKLAGQSEQTSLADLTQAQQASSRLEELRAAEGMLDRRISFIDPETSKPLTEKVKAVVLQDGAVWLETDKHRLTVADVQRIEL